MTTTSRRPWVAFSLSLLMPGLGQFYCGRWMAAALFYGSLLILAVFYRWAGAFEWPREVFVIIGGAAIVLLLAAAIEAAAGARQPAQDDETSFNRWYFYVPAVLGNLLVVFAIASLNNYRIPAAAMDPTLMVGDSIVTSSYAFPMAPPARCDVAVFEHEANGKRVAFVKRVIALEGESIAYQNGRLVINGATVERERVSEDAAGTIYRETLPGGCSYLIREQNDSGFLDNTPVYNVPGGTVFVLGDNRDDSMDSRTAEVGFVALQKFRGRVFMIYNAEDSSRIGWLH